MKNTFKFAMWMGVAAMLTITSCSRKEEIVPKEENESKVAAQPFRMTVESGDPSTKTVISEEGDSYNVLWQAGDELGVFEVGGTGVQDKTSSEPLESSGETAAFNLMLEGDVPAPYSYTFVYPASALDKKGDNYLVTIPFSQTFQPNSFDSSADVLVSEYIEFPLERPEFLSTRFARLGGTARMVIKAPSTEEVIESISFSTSEAALAGSYYLDLANGDVSDGIMAQASDNMLLIPAVATTYTDEVVVWFRLAQVTLAKDFSVSVRTNSKTYTKTVDLATPGRSLTFAHGKLTKFNVNMIDVEGKDNTQEVITEDVINIALTGVNSNSYTDWADKTSNSDAVYAGKTTKGKSVIQTNYKSPYGIWTTASGGYVKSVTISLVSANANTVNVYAKNSAYASGDLYDDSKKGTLVGSVTGSATEDVTQKITVSGDYTYIGICSSKGVVYISEIKVEWSNSSSTTTGGATVVTGEASDITATTAILSGTYSNAAEGIYEAGFYFRLKGSSDEWIPVTTDGSNDSAGEFFCTLESLAEYTDYEYKAYVLEFDEDAKAFVERFGIVKYFKTQTHSTDMPGGWLELPAYDTAAMAGTTTSALNDLYEVTHFATMQGSRARNYTILYDPEMFTSYWVAYPLCKAHLGSGRSDQWAYDPDVPKEKQTNVKKGYGVNVPSEQYKTQSYARGHQVPNADRNGVSAMAAQTYYATNVTPQLQNGFNSSIWNQMEEAVRGVLKNATDTVYVVTGAAFRKNGGSETINYIVNKNDSKSLPVPNYYWKVLLKVHWSGNVVSEASAIAFWFEHRDDYGKHSYTEYATSVDQLEEWTGFDFFANISETLQAAAESNANWSAFKSF